MTQSYEETDASHVLTMEEITNLTEEGGKPADTLMNVVALIATRFRTDVCSAYLLEPDRSNLVLAATLGLHPRCIGTLRMPHQRRPLRPGRGTGAARRRGGCQQTSTFQVLQRVRRRGIPLLSGRAADRSRHSAGRPRGADKRTKEIPGKRNPHVGRSRKPGRARGQRGAHPRSFHRPGTGAALVVARNLCWCWDHDCISLFRDLNPTRWRQLNQNPIALLNEMPLGELERRATELGLHSRINYVYRRQQEYLKADRTWGAINAGVLRPRPVAYFSAEFGLHESLPIYSGGLGVLAGDHIKSASDLDIPLIGIGLFYGQGYFLQRLDKNGWQREEYLAPTSTSSPCSPPSAPTASRWWWKSKPAADPSGPRSGGSRWAAATFFCSTPTWPATRPRTWTLTSRLYGGDARTRIRQELLLGVGGFRALKAMGITPGVLHLNEGHSGFAVFEAIRSRMEEEGLDFYAAASQIPREVIFTTHTPVPAGHDRFTADLIEEHLGPLRDQLGISHENLMGFGREHPTDHA